MTQETITKPVALVTGASSGMGKDFVKALLQKNMVVYAVARRTEKMQDLDALGAKTLKMDITEDQDIFSVVEKISEEQGRLDFLVNNAGFGSYGAMEDTKLEDARYQFEVNLFGLARLTQLVLPMMRKQQSGKIINISSMGGKVYTPLGSWYHATKHALEGWSDCLRLELKNFNIDVVLIEPGAIETEFGDVMVGPMLQRSGEGPYSNMAKAMATTTEASYQEGGSSTTAVITKLLLNAVVSKRPKTRYVAGKYAKPMMFIRKWFGDRVYDKIVMSMVK